MKKDRAMKLTRRNVLLYGSGALLPSLSSANNYPDAPIRLVVGFPPGGGTDGAARLIAEKLGPEMGQTIIVDNRAGAGGTIGAQAVARAAPDGYTLFFGTGAELLINPITRKKTSYDLLSDFAPITEVGGVTFLLVVPASTPATNIHELVALAKTRSNGLHFSSFGEGSTNHLIGELFRISTGINATHVPYKGSQPAMLALLGEEVDFSFETTAVALPQIKAGKLRALATPSPKRLRDLPEVPTLREAGYPDLVAEGWMGVFAPAGTPAAVLAKLGRALDKVIRDPDINAKLTARGVLVTGADAATFRKKLESELVTWRRVASQARISID